jgi:ABC-type branched-subunit amino acid transport system ATPase component
MALLAEGVHSGYGELEILTGVDLRAEMGSITGLIGPNGAGKSTLLKTIFGYLKTRKGKVTFKDKEITNLSPRGILGVGISYIAQAEGLFPHMTVRENLRLGGFLIRDKRVLGERIDWVLRISNLEGRVKQSAGSLSGGERRILEIGRGLMLDPEMVLLDEPSAALAPKLVDSVFEHIRQINEENRTSFLIVEQDVNLILDKADYVFAMQLGSMVHGGPPEDFRKDERLRTLFLGKG